MSTSARSVQDANTNGASDEAAAMSARLHSDALSPPPPSTSQLPDDDGPYADESLDAINSYPSAAGPATTSSPSSHRASVRSSPRAPVSSSPSRPSSARVVNLAAGYFNPAPMTPIVTALSEPLYAVSSLPSPTTSDGGLASMGATTPVVVSRTPSRVAAQVRRSPGTPSRTRNSPGGVTNWQFPAGSVDGGSGGSRASTPARKPSGGVFRNHFSHSASASRLADPDAEQPLVASPLGEFGSLGHNSAARKKSSARNGSHGAPSPSRGSSSRSGGVGAPELDLTISTDRRRQGASSNSGMGLGRSASAMSFASVSPPPPTASEAHALHTSSSTSALGIAHASAAARDAAEAYTAAATSGAGAASFARRMIHAQSAAELYRPSHPADPMTDDPDAASLFFERAGPRSAAHNAGEEESQALVPYHIAPNAHGVYSYASPSSRPRTSAGVSSTGIAWSARLTASLAEDEEDQPVIRKRRSGGRPTTSSTTRARAETLPAELSVGLETMSAHMQREHASLARLINSLEPAGKASLTPPVGGVFSKLGTASRAALFNNKPSYYDASQANRLDHASESDEYLRRRSLQKGVELHRQSASMASRGPSGLGTAHFSPADVARAVVRSNDEYPISDERPRPARPPTASHAVAVAAATAAAGSSAAAQIVQTVVSPQKRKQSRPGTAASTSSGSRRQASSSDVLLPGFGVVGHGSSSVGGGVLGFGGSIDRFGGAIDELRYVNTSTSHLGGRGMLATRSAAKLLAGTIPTSSEGATAAGAATTTPTTTAVTNTSSKRFASLALEFEVDLAERLARLDVVGSDSGRVSAASVALERLDVFRTALDSIIVASPHFGGLLARIKTEYESYARRGDGASDGPGASNPAGIASLADRNQQQLEDTLVLENHRLHTKLHGFQRAYTSLYAKYKASRRTQKVQEGMLAQNALVLADLNEQLQQAVLAGMSEEERCREMARRAGLKLANEEDGGGGDRATLPDLDYEDEEELLALGLGDGSEASRRAIHARKVLRAKEAARAAHARANDPLERGRQMMRDYQMPPHAPVQLDLDDVYGEGATNGDSHAAHAHTSSDDPVLSPSKLVRFLESEVGGPSESEVAANASRLARANPAEPAEMLASNPDPLEYLDQKSRRQVAQYKSRAVAAEEALLRVQTQLDQARAKEMAALMAMEEVTKQRYANQLEAARQAAVSIKKMTPPLPHERVPVHALEDDVPRVPSSSGVSIPSLPLDDLLGSSDAADAPVAGTNPDEFDDEDPDNELVDDGDVDRTLAHLRRDQEDSEASLAQLQADDEMNRAARRQASLDADAAFREEVASQETRKASLIQRAKQDAEM